MVSFTTDALKWYAENAGLDIAGPEKYKCKVKRHAGLQKCYTGKTKECGGITVEEIKPTKLCHQ